MRLVFVRRMPIEQRFRDRKVRRHRVVSDDDPTRTTDHRATLALILALISFETRTICRRATRWILDLSAER